MTTRRVVTHTIWIILVLCASVSWYLPLNYWQPLIQRLALSPQISIQTLEGHWWGGQANIKVPKLKGLISIRWNGVPLFNNADINIEHNQFQILGGARADGEGVSFDIDYARVKADIANPMLSAQRVGLSGLPIYLSKWQANWNWGVLMPTSISGEGHWSSGDIFFRNGNRSQKAVVSNWQLLVITQENQPRFGLLNAKGDKMVDIKGLDNDEFELSIMPAFLKALGMNWTGDPTYPAFVLVQPIELSM
ncbi:hypothetical protein [Marinomonas mediterranea]|jgi:hypothetical protein|uniref:General secretion pathway protein N n=1 Tax=Marinomonas mediterranea (strain ATCC 700492 / JCM 21426 / NBRC 103028 / MMB-1) TaxID=717774 RepID=F2K4U5_MARM1|nr:hypothetical protein [Marinomonas mediterranea]ADZ92588.1 hypothetical protein Marme_3372 [Marinomonas mediterranea MMB-1]WCN10531.1 hypothetical protein GV055_17180 [Marinomonas mediterranea]WCN14581.1 hypothetical protein GV054_17005 [Marinomonas mediterranea]WCN18630.1 hypothetical protein GV053_17070 [Marinomonas mediterranea MMB-1]